MYYILSVIDSTTVYIPYHIIPYHIMQGISRKHFSDDAFWQVLLEINLFPLFYDFG